MYRLRKVYRLQGIGGSIYVALPREWVRRFNLDKGSLVEISIENDGSLRIRPVDSANGRREEVCSRIEIEVQNPREAMNALVMSYLQGYDTIAIRFGSRAIEKEVRRAIAEAQKVLLGLEVIDETSNTIVLQVLSSSDSDVHTLMRSMSNIARSMYLDVVVSLITRDLELANAIPLRDLDLNKLYFYTTRIIRKRIVCLGLSMDPKELLKLLDLRLLAKVIEEIGDEAKRGAKAVSELLSRGIDVDEDAAKELSNRVNELDSLYRESIRALFEFSERSRLYEVMRRCEELRRIFSELRARATEKMPRGILWLNDLYSSYENIAALIYDVASLVPI